MSVVFTVGFFLVLFLGAEGGSPVIEISSDEIEGAAEEEDLVVDFFGGALEFSGGWVALALATFFGITRAVCFVTAIVYYLQR